MYTKISKFRGSKAKLGIGVTPLYKCDGPRDTRDTDAQVRRDGGPVTRYVALFPAHTVIRALLHVPAADCPSSIVIAKKSSTEQEIWELTAQPQVPSS